MAEDILKPSEGADTDQDGDKARNSPNDSVSRSRRGLMKAGLIAAPLILTLKSRPALAAGPNNRVSRFSVGKSHHPYGN